MNTEAPGNFRHVFSARPPRSLLGKLLTFVLGAVLLVLAFMFSLVALAVAAVGGIILAGWLWWKTRAVRKQIATAQTREEYRFRETSGGTIIEGEVVRETETTPSERRLN